MLNRKIAEEILKIAKELVSKKEYKTVSLRTEKGIKEAEKLKEQGWQMGSHGLDSIQFYRQKK